MRKVFWDDPYQQKLSTIVLSVEEERVCFSETIAFSFSGGQESDRAYVNNIAILGSEMVGNDIFYKLPQNHGLQPGDSVIMEIDWPRRYALMRLHFAAELVLELVTRALHVEKIGAHIAESKARIDFGYEGNISTVFALILNQYDEIIAKNLPIKTGFTDVVNQRRFWEIEGFSKVSCGGTHVKSTAEVGRIKLKRVNIGCRKERIEIVLQ